MESGIIAESPARYSQARNNIKVPPAPQKSPMTVALFHGYSVPPHSRAIKSMIAEGANRKKPTMSNLRRMDRVVRFSVLVLSMRSGILIARRKIETTAPIGRLM
jgi:hypothetical protein